MYGYLLCCSLWLVLFEFSDYQFLLLPVSVYVKTDENLQSLAGRNKFSYFVENDPFHTFGFF